MSRLLLWQCIMALAMGSLLVQAKVPQILVIKDTNLQIGDYSIFWDSLTDRGYGITFRGAEEIEPSLYNHDETTFDHLILFAPESKNFPVDLSPQNLYHYVEQAKNVLVVVSPNLSEFWRDFSREFEVEFDDRGQYVIDHYHHDHVLDEGTHTTLIVPVSSANSPFVSTATQAGPPLLFRGIGHATSRIPFLQNLLHAEATAYSCDISNKDSPTEDFLTAGSSIGLVSSFQARNNARISFVGSLDLFSNLFASSSVSELSGNVHQSSGNVAFIQDLTKWTFQERGVLKIQRVRHSRVSDGISRALYKVRDKLLYEIELASWQDGHWASYFTSDLQLEFTMLDPHLRLALSASSDISLNSTSYSSIFEAPDRHGVFTLNVDYRRTGWSYLNEKTVVSVTPPSHDQYDRFITGALPYYGSAFSVSIAVIVFVIMWTLQ